MCHDLSIIFDFFSGALLDLARQNRLDAATMVAKQINANPTQANSWPALVGAPPNRSFAVAALLAMFLGLVACLPGDFITS